MERPISPSISELTNNIKRQLCTGPRGVPSVNSVLADVMAANNLMLHKHIESVGLEFNPVTASEYGLTIMGRTYSVERKQATKTEFKAEFKDDDKKKIVTLPIGTKIISSNNVSYALSDNSVFECDNTGEIDHIAKGDTVNLIQTLLGVGKEGVITEILTLGTNKEDLETYRERIIQRIQNPVMGGNKDDYDTWMKQLPFCTHVYQSDPESGPYFTIYFLCKNREGILPTSAEIIEAQKHINKLRPKTAFPVVKALRKYGQKVLISISDDKGIKEGIHEINKLFKEFLIDRAEPGKGLEFFDVQRFLIKDANLDCFRLEFSSLSVAKDEILIDCEFVCNKRR